MTDFANDVVKNIMKLSFISIGTVFSVMGLRTELTMILQDVATATWISICWFFLIVIVCAYYKAKQDTKLECFIKHEMNRAMMNLSTDHRTVAENLFENKIVLVEQEKA